LRTAATIGFQDPKDFLNFLSDTDLTKKHIVTLARDLTVGETYFFRHHLTYEALKNTILPEIIERRRSSRRIRIWSAGCCTGEEPYSIAILMKQLIRNLPEWNVSLLGTDINEEFLQKAQAGAYKEWSFRDTPSTIKGSYFTKIDDKHYQLNQDIRNMVKFEFLNLISNSYPSDDTGTQNMDLILCNNVLIYFSQEKIKEVIEKFSSALTDQGWLVVSTIEVPFIENANLLQTKVGDLFFFRKGKKNLPAAKAEKPRAPKKIEIKRETPPIAPISPKPKQEPLKDSNKPLEWEAFYLAQNYERSAALLEKELERRHSAKEKSSKSENEIAHLIKSYANLGNIPKAREWCERGLMETKINPLFHYLHGMILQEVDSYEDAVAAYRKALFLDPNFIMAHFSLGSISLKKGDIKTARRHLRNSLELLSRGRPGEILLGTDELVAERLLVIVDNLLKDSRLKNDE
jgi:chemotaxis protein methyltransferase CheR